MFIALSSTFPAFTTPLFFKHYSSYCKWLSLVQALLWGHIHVALNDGTRAFI